MSPGATPEAQGARRSGRAEGTRRGLSARRNLRGGKRVNQPFHVRDFHGYNFLAGSTHETCAYLYEACGNAVTYLFKVILTAVESSLFNRSMALGDYTLELELK